MNCAFPGEKGERESNLDQGSCSMCSRSSIKSFGSSDLQFLHKSWYFMNRNQWIDVWNGYKMILERSSNHLAWFWKLRQPQDHSNLGWIDDCTNFPFSCKFKQNKQHPKWPSTNVMNESSTKLSAKTLEEELGEIVNSIIFFKINYPLSWFCKIVNLFSYTMDIRRIYTSLVKNTNACP